MPHPVANPLCVYETEKGTGINLKVKGVTINVQGLSSTEEAEELAGVLLLVMARRRNALPRLVSERTPTELLKRLRETT